MVIVAGLTAVPFTRANSVAAETEQASQKTVRPVGAVKAVRGNTILLALDSGSDIDVIVQDSTRIIRTAPGQNDLKGATPIQLADVQVGDRILVRGTSISGDKSVAASSLIVMTRTDIAERQARNREDWQKRGVGGLVSAVDLTSKTITLSTSHAGGKGTAIHVANGTILRRYAPDSTRFDDATIAPLDQIKPGDQLRARGTRSADGTEFDAVEIVSGSFRHIAGTIAAIDANKNTVSITDLATKKLVVVKIVADSQIRKLPPMIAQRLAMSSKPTPGTAQRVPSTGERRSPRANPMGATPGDASAPTTGGDLQQMLSRVPAVTIAELHKGDAVMVVATQGTATNESRAIMFLSGVEPLLTSPNGGDAATLLSPWDLASSSGEGE